MCNNLYIGLPKMLIKYKIIILICVFLMGVPVGYVIKKNKIVETVKIEKVIDKQAVLEAVKRERDNIYKSIKQTKVKETFKKPNGETTIIEKIETNTDENKIIRNDLSKIIKAYSGAIARTMWQSETKNDITPEIQTMTVTKQWLENKIKELQGSTKLKRSLVNELDESVKTCENLVNFNFNLYYLFKYSIFN